MNIFFYAGSLRPGGGLTVAKIMLESLAEDDSNNIIVYTGARDSSKILQPLFEANSNVIEKKFFHGVNSEIRYLISKIYFLYKSIFNRTSLVISINYFLPVICKQLVYHLNLLSFTRQKNDSIFKIFKEFDASIACRFATINVFESDFLKDTAEEYTGKKIRNPKRLYIGVDPAFYTDEHSGKYFQNANILLVSSTQPHKDNYTCVDTLVELYKTRKNVNWKIVVAGGQSVEQWLDLKRYAEKSGVSDKIDFLGPVDKKHLSKLMSESLCLISASKIESFCMVALEAMASRCPVIVTNDTSMPESVGDAGIVVDSGSVDQFARNIIKIHDNENYRTELIKKGESRSKLFSTVNFKIQLRDII